MPVKSANTQNRWLIAAILLVAIELLSVMGWISRMVPIVYKDATTGLPQPIPPGLEPEREMLLYGITCALIIAAGYFVLIRRIRLPSVYLNALPQFVLVQSSFVIIELALAFKLITYHHPFYPVLVFENSAWIIPTVCGVFLISLLSKIFWPECVAVVRFVEPRARTWRPSKWMSVGAEGAVIAVTVLLLWIPDANVPLALSFWGDRVRGLDQKIGWLIGLGWDYPTAFYVLLIGAIAKVALFYGFLRLWRISFWLSVAGLLWLIKWQFFYYDANPTGWLTGLDLSWPLVVGGLDNGPMFAPLRMREFWAFDMSFAIPVVYTGILFFMSARQILGAKTRDGMIAIALAVIGLILFADAIMRPSIGRYAICAWPLIAIVIWGIDNALRRWIPLHKQWAGIALALFMFTALVTNRVFVVYPNVFNARQDRYVQYIGSWQKIWDFSSKAALIQKMVPAGQPAAIISSFECRLLQQTDRRSLWPITPLLRSAYPGENELPTLAVWRKTDLRRILDTLQSRQPRYLFVEAKLWEAFKSSPEITTGLGALMNYAVNHYEPVGQEDFLLVLRRKE